jgi:hypothetical protein
VLFRSFEDLIVNESASSLEILEVEGRMLIL